VKDIASVKIIGIVCTLGLALAACGGSSDPDAENGAGEPTSQAEAPTSAPEPTEFAYSGPDPAPGTGNVYGRIFWNSLPAAGVAVEICDDIDYYDGCIGEQYATTTDEDGMFLFADVTPMSYGLEYEALEADGWIYITSGIFDAADFEVSADEVLFAGDFDAVKYNMQVVSPAADSVVNEAQPSLAWQPYAEAAYYSVTLNPERGASLFLNFELDGTSVTSDRDLLNCSYSWSVKAYNAQGVQIAETDRFWYFEVAGQPFGCKMTGLAPADGASLGGENIVLSWDVHELAAYYKVSLYDESSNAIVDFVNADGPRYTITQNLAAGDYTWVVYAYNESDDFFAFSETYTLIVTGP
jgi:hypothetical protein